VSEVIYLSDPDGNWTEVYRDHPLIEWEYKDGRIKISTDPFESDGVMACAQAGGDWIGLTPGTILGHTHLHVGDFETFAGEYHQLRINTWNSVGAFSSPRRSFTLLLSYTFLSIFLEGTLDNAPSTVEPIQFTYLQLPCERRFQHRLWSHILPLSRTNR
jgi:catechol-2,3-dioxygenase